MIKGCLQSACGGGAQVRCFLAINFRGQLGVLSAMAVLCQLWVGEVFQ